MTFTGTTVNAADAAQLKQLNEALATVAYADGYEPSARDASLYTSIGNSKIVANQYPHVARWHHHIASFTDAERAAWTGGVAPTTSDAPAAEEEEIDLFGSDDEEDDEEKKRVTEARLKAYAEKKAKKGPGPVAKSNIIFDVKPWDDTIDTKEIEKKVREITTDGLVWGASKILPVAFGINKLQIMCVVEDAKVSTDWLEEQITDIEELVQSVDVVAFNKV